MMKGRLEMRGSLVQHVSPVQLRRQAARKKYSDQLEVKMNVVL